MEKIVMLACLLIFVSTILKIWSVVALYNLSITIEKEDHLHHIHHLDFAMKKGQQVH